MAYVIDTNRKSIQEKIGQVKNLTEAMKKYKTVAMLDLRQLPDSLLQSLRKKIRDEGGQVYVLKKAVTSRALKTNKKLAEHVDECNDRPVLFVDYQKSQFIIS